MIPAIQLSDDEIASGSLRADTFLVAKQIFHNKGVLMIENAFNAQFIKSLADLVSEDSAHLLDDYNNSEALVVGHKRLMLTLELKGALNSASLYANPLLMTLIQELLGPNFILGSLGGVISLPGAEDQHFHRDHPFLFRQESIDIAMPSFAINVLIPLIGLNENYGTTRIWPGSHRLFAAEEALALPSYDPIAQPGSCLLLDYRLVHGGTANVSPVARPLLYAVYHRPWFKDFVNFRKFAALRISAEEFANVPEDYREWFRHAVVN